MALIADSESPLDSGEHGDDTVCLMPFVSHYFPNSSWKHGLPFVLIVSGKPKIDGTWGIAHHSPVL